MSETLPTGSSPWPAPARVFCSDRGGGVSLGPWASNNIGEHVEDDAEAVRANREGLAALTGASKVQWLDQVHGISVLALDDSDCDSSGPLEPHPAADAMWTTQPGIALAIQTADCLPVVLADSGGQLVAAAHAGWRGLCDGVLRTLVEQLPVPRESLHAFIGPAISQAEYEVGPEVVQAFADAGFEIGDVAKPGLGDRWLLDLVSGAKGELQQLGVHNCGGGHWCTAADRRFYSWRRETRRASEAGVDPLTGRQATLVWLPSPP